MTARTVLSGLVVTLVGAALAGGAYWELLRVPESNVLALLLSALLVLAAALILGVTIGAVIAIAGGASLRAALARGVRALPGFLLGTVVLLALVWLSGSIDGQWALHRGEIDALFLRYAGTDRTAVVHTSIAWFMWLLRWGLGLASVAAATAGVAAAPGGAVGGSAVRGLGQALAPQPLGATVLALLAGWGLWSSVYWRPKGLTADVTELAFVSVKLSALFLVGAVLVVLVLHVFARRADAERGPTST
ncbi:MAG: hypothetical protein ABL982_01670 [Vicinamibacterales bacterium]